MGTRLCLTGAESVVKQRNDREPGVRVGGDTRGKDRTRRDYALQSFAGIARRSCARCHGHKALWAADRRTGG